MSKKPFLLFIDVTLKREDESRTYALCRSYLETFQKYNPDYEIRHLTLRSMNLLPNLQEDIEQRDELMAAGSADDPRLKYAVEFAEADRILIGAPYWDLSFPALLKIYLEKVCVCGITFSYTETGEVRHLCNAERITYLQACGGNIGGMDFGADYVEGLCSRFLGIREFETEAAEMLDVKGMDIDKIMREACARCAALAKA